MDINSISGGARTDISEMLAKLREVSNKSPVFTENTAKPTNGFEDVMSLVKNAVSHVNNVQAETDSLKSAYVTGDGNVSMSQIIVASQKSKLAFEGLLAVRNKILESYKEIMNMPV
jgi:flagellar hook-basal body complex protein FliE